MPIRRKSHSGNESGHYKYTVSFHLHFNGAGQSFYYPLLVFHLFTNLLPTFISNLCKNVQKEIEVFGRTGSLFNFLPHEKLSACTTLISSNPKGARHWYLHPSHIYASGVSFRLSPSPVHSTAKSSYLQLPLWQLPSSHTSCLPYYMAELPESCMVPTSFSAFGQEALSALDSFI